MKSVCCAASLAFASLLAVSAPRPALAESQVEITYEEPTNPELRPIYEELKALAVLQPFVDQEQLAKVRDRQWFTPAELQEK